LFVWGTGIYGTLPRPKQIRTNEKLVDVKVGGTFMAMVAEKGAVMVWGLNQTGEIGLGENKDPCYTPRTVETINDKVVSAVAVGSCFAFAIG
jgi:alpha-tubulin suppressor-like RCC1 family protein